MELTCTCQYCGYKWTLKTFSKEAIKSIQCLICKDTNIRVVDDKNSKIDYYEGCPAFPEKKTEEEEKSILEEFESLYRYM